MFVENGIIRFEAKNEKEQWLLNHIKRRNGWAKQRRFNSFKDNQDGTVTLFLQDGYETKISKDRLSEVIKSGKVVGAKWRCEVYAQLEVNKNVFPLHRFLMRNELAKYEGFEEATGLKIQVNHIDENSLNNTDENLEVVTAAENRLKYSLNHSKGFAMLQNGKFKVLVCGKSIGVYETEEEARQAYVEAVKNELKRLEQIRIDFLKSNGRL